VKSWHRYYDPTTGRYRKNPLMETNRLNHLIMPKTGGINLSENAMKIAKSLQLG
jgi:hypothetical protein